MREAVVLAGGFGTRLRSVVPDLPKPMAPVAGRPFLEILLSALAAKEFSRVILSLGFMAEKVARHFADTFRGMELIYEVENSPLGTGGALRRALPRCISDHVFVFNGDTFLDLEVEDVEAHWIRERVPIVVAREVEDTARYGRLATSGSRLVGFSEKGFAGGGLINAGCYVLPGGLLDDFVLDQPFSFEQDYLVRAVANRRVDFHRTAAYFIDIGIPEDYTRAQVELGSMYP